MSTNIFLYCNNHFQIYANILSFPSVSNQVIKPIALAIVQNTRFHQGAETVIRNRKRCLSRQDLYESKRSNLQRRRVFQTSTLPRSSPKVKIGHLWKKDCDQSLENTGRLISLHEYPDNRLPSPTPYSQYFSVNWIIHF